MKVYIFETSVEGRTKLVLTTHKTKRRSRVTWPNGGKIPQIEIIDTGESVGRLVMELDIEWYREGVNPEKLIGLFRSAFPDYSERVEALGITRAGDCKYPSLRDIGCTGCPLDQDLSYLMTERSETE